MHALALWGVGTIGFLAQFIDGALGMGYGVISSAFLISLGIPPPMASASVHTSELFTTFVSGVSHFKFNNIRKDLLGPLVSFGMMGGIMGACGLVKLPSRSIQFIVGPMLLMLGGIIFYRFMFKYPQMDNSIIKKYPVNKLRGLGFLAAFIDALCGGGWGPICTSALVVTGTEPNKAIGSVNLAEFFITCAIASTFMVFIWVGNFRWDLIIALIGGGVIAAPLAALSCKKLPRHLLGILVGIIIILLSLRICLKR